MSLRVLALLFVVCVASICATPLQSSASYSSEITSPQPHFTTIPGVFLATAGNVGWTWLFDDAATSVKVTLYDGHGNKTSQWANCSVGFWSTTWEISLSTSGLQGEYRYPGIDESLITAEAYASSNGNGYIGQVGSDANLTGHISV